MAGKWVLALDEGSSSARAVLFDTRGIAVADASEPITPLFPKPSWVELDPAQLWSALHNSILNAMAQVGAEAKDIAAVGITTHRETTVMWNRSTGQPIHNAVMWMSKQTDPIISRWSQQGLDPVFREKTGVRNDSYFSAGKIVWLLDNVPAAREAANKGDLAIGTPDTWLLWNLTGGASHKTDKSAASRTALLNVKTGDWDRDLIDTLGIPPSLLPELIDSNGEFGVVAEGVLPGRSGDPVPIRAVLGDQQAGLFGQACVHRGMAKNTFGTAGVLTVNVGPQPLLIDGMSTSVAWQFDGSLTCEAEGVVFHSGQTMQWLRDRLGLFSDTADTGAIAASVPGNGGVYMVPAFAGLCDPYWDRNVRAAIVGLQLDTDKAHIVRAGLESMAYQTWANVDALTRGGLTMRSLRVDGGAVANDWLCQFQADILGIPVERPVGIERTAHGVAHIAGSGVGLWSLDDIAATWQVDRVFEPSLSHDQAEALRDGWRHAVEAARSLPPAPTTT
jgi:glycerol kinase